MTRELLARVLKSGFARTVAGPATAGAQRRRSPDLRTKVLVGCLQRHVVGHHDTLIM